MLLVSYVKQVIQINVAFKKVNLVISLKSVVFLPFLYFLNILGGNFFLNVDIAGRSSVSAKDKNR